MDSVRPGLVVAIFIGALLISFINARSIVTGLGGLTGGNRVADVGVGLLLTIGPGCLALAAGRTSARLGYAPANGCFLLALFGPAFALLPYYRGADLDPDLVSTINRQLPDITIALGCGELVVLLGGAVILLRWAGGDDRGRARRQKSRRRPRRR